MTTSEQAKFKMLVSLLDEKEVEVKHLQSISGLDVYNFSGALTDLLSEGHITSKAFFGQLTTVTITSKGLNYLILLKAASLNDVVQKSETAKTIKVVGKVAGKHLGILGGKLNTASNKAAYKAQEYLIIKALEREEARMIKDVEEFIEEQEESERQAELLAEILEVLADKQEGFEPISIEIELDFGEACTCDDSCDETCDETCCDSDEPDTSDDDVSEKSFAEALLEGLRNKKSASKVDIDLEDIKSMGDKFLKELKEVDVKKFEQDFKQKLDASGAKELEKELKSNMSSLFSTLASKLAEKESEDTSEDIEKPEVSDEAKKVSETDDELMANILKASSELKQAKKEEVKEEPAKKDVEVKEPKAKKAPKKEKADNDEPKEEKAKKAPKKAKAKKEVKEDKEDK